MPDMVLFHNPNCSKSRGALEILTDKGVDVTVVRYLENPPSEDTLTRIVDLISDEPSELVRKDAKFRELGLNADDYRDRDAVVALLLEHPELMQRPIGIRGEQAVIGRPSEKIEELL